MAGIICGSLCLLTPHSTQLVKRPTNQLLIMFSVATGNDHEVTITRPVLNIDSIRRMTITFTLAVRNAALQKKESFFTAKGTGKTCGNI